MTASTRPRVSSDTSSTPWTTFETVDFETPGFVCGDVDRS